MFLITEPLLQLLVCYPVSPKWNGMSTLRHRMSVSWLGVKGLPEAQKRRWTFETVLGLLIFGVLSEIRPNAFCIPR